MSGLSGHAGRIGRLLQEGDQPVLRVHVHHAEAGRLHARDFEAADGDVRTGLHVLLQHRLVVHLVDVVAGEQDDVLRGVALDDVDVLIHGVGRAGIPGGFADALAGGQDVEALVALGPEEVPAALQVADQRVRLVLRGHADAADAGVQGIGQGEVDDAALAAEIYGGLGAGIRHLVQARAAAAGQDIGHGMARQGRVAVGMAGISALSGRCRGGTPTRCPVTYGAPRAAAMGAPACEPAEPIRALPQVGQLNSTTCSRSTDRWPAKWHSVNPMSQVRHKTHE